ncbi:MAG: FtsL-like putative cell division protein [Ekhidna sp.]|uniref:FtsL-like putative cell division protein n=1 Tax=Ekhidna sp. TaxID=2608089 RepID=UPI0032F08C38
MTKRNRTMKNTYKLPQREERGGLFRLISRFLRMDSSMSEVIHVRFLPQILFLAFLCLLYIGNRHYAEKKIRDINDLETEVEDLRADYTTLKADFMYESKQSEVAKRAAELGLKESKESPVLIREVEN